MGHAPIPEDRADAMELASMHFKTMVTIEPIMDFDVHALSSLIYRCNPEWVNIGADSKGNLLPEPKKWKINQLIGELKENEINIKYKTNLKRLLK